MRNLSRVVVALAAVALLGLHGPADAAAKPGWTKNCTALNKKYHHGVGRTGAHDHVTSGRPVTTFKRSNAAYKEAMKFDKGLDRDHDKIACEKR